MEGTDRLAVRDVEGGCLLKVKAVPGASRDRLAGVLGDALKIATATAAEKGKANAALARALARALEIDPRTVTLASGPRNPHKEFHIAGLTAKGLREILALL